MLIISNDSPSFAAAAPALCNPQNVQNALDNKLPRVWLHLHSLDDIVQWLDKGVDVVLISSQSVSEATLQILKDIPKSRLALTFKTIPPESILCLFQYLVVDDIASVSSLSTLTNRIIYHSKNDDFPFIKKVVQENKNIDVIVDSNLFNGNLQNFVELYMINVVSDRSDGLFSTIVVDEQNVSLGLCYSSAESIYEALKSMTGVYFSRKRGIWHKGKTSGATQVLLRIDLDCDCDTFQFTVKQDGPGFCHLNTASCFGNLHGINSLYHTLSSRIHSAPANSYTKRLFTDTDLLNNKIVEEANELCSAVTKDDVAWEAADLFYFAMVKCVAAGISLSDIEHSLDLKSKQITRRKGDAKVSLPKKVLGDARVDLPKKVLPSDIPDIPDYHMRVYKHSGITQDIRKGLLKRPIINTNEIMSRVRPICEKVMNEGDSALLMFTKKFDNVELTSSIMKSPFDPSLMQLSPKVQAAIDQAFENIMKFHSAQLDSEPLIVETMPGVTCTRFARAIERVGLYVPGGTAILPSTALMLGIPAKVF
jgi:phosphoribosyl-ATP pyrophosphohydrolase/phosphoribosyl-AMP cyclohydrolase/histidinol dehydrogenase